MVDGESPIGNTGDLPYRAAQLAKNRRRDRPADATAGIHDDVERARQFGNIL